MCRKLFHFIWAIWWFPRSNYFEAMKAGKLAIQPWLSCPYNKHTLVDLPSFVFTLHHFEEIYQFFWRYRVLSSKKVGRFFQIFVASWEYMNINRTMRRWWKQWNWHIYILNGALQCKMSDWVNLNQRPDHYTYQVSVYLPSISILIIILSILIFKYWYWYFLFQKRTEILILQYCFSNQYQYFSTYF